MCKKKVKKRKAHETKPSHFTLSAGAEKYGYNEKVVVDATFHTT
jgi:hypothetical protein